MIEQTHRCIFCGNITIDGIQLRGRLICSECEQELINTQVDEPAYQSYKQGIKAIWKEAITLDSRLNE